MESKYGFTKFTIAEFEAWIAQIKVARNVRTLQQHHTYIPGYKHFKGDNHFKMQKGMKNYHVNSNGWSDIGQHFTSFPDGTIVTGRSLERSPACIYGFNANSICIEHIGDFDTGKDEMTEAHASTAIRMTAAICKKFSIAINTDKIVYHHWFDLSNGRRNNGTGRNKSCPGTNFFGGNKVEDCEANFIPKVKAILNDEVSNKPKSKLLKHVAVSANRLNIRTGAGTSFSKAKNRNPALLGAILRVYDEKNGWYKISSSTDHWVSGRYTRTVKNATVTASKLNARSGPDTTYHKVDAFPKGEELWIEKTKGDWCKIVFDETWVSKKYLKFDV